MDIKAKKTVEREEENRDSWSWEKRPFGGKEYSLLCPLRIGGTSRHSGSLRIARGIIKSTPDQYLWWNALQSARCLQSARGAVTQMKIALGHFVPMVKKGNAMFHIHFSHSTFSALILLPSPFQTPEESVFHGCLPSEANGRAELRY